MAFIDEFLIHDAVYWGTDDEPGGGAEEGGQPNYDDPIEIRCRWRQVTQELVGPAATKILSTQMVVVDRAVVEQGVLWRGVLSDLTSDDDPFKNPGAFRIQSYREVADVDDPDDVVRRAFL